MARIPYVESENAHWLTREILARRNNRNIHRMLGHSGPLADAFVRLATTLRYESELDSALREIAILRVGVLSGATYEVTAHRAHARNAGLSDAQIAAVEAGDDRAAVLTSLQQSVMRFADDVVTNVRASDATFSPLKAELGPRPLVELVVAIGFYMAACRFLETFDIDVHT
jgi:4-carboxymuconolactone decarboxylase